MNKDWDDIIDAILRGESPERPESEEFAARLAERRALRGRLQTAFESIRPDEGLAGRLRHRLARTEEPGSSAEAGSGASRRIVRLPRGTWAALAAAAIVALAVGLSISLPGPARAESARQEFARLHTGHLAPGAELVAGENPAEVAARLEQRLDFVPVAPQAVEAVRFRGACVDRFRNRPAASFVLETSQGPVSIIVTPVPADSLGLGHRFEQAGHILWACRHGNCRIVGTAANGTFYFAVGEAPREFLTQLVLQTLPRATG